MFNSFLLSLQLEYLDLSFNNVSDHEAKLLSKCVEKIKVLDLLETDITEIGVNILRNAILETNAVKRNICFACYLSSGCFAILHKCVAILHKLR